MQRIDKLWWCVVALLGATMVMLGAYAAHGLSARTSAAMVDIVETGVRYQAWHTLAMLAVLAWRSQRPLPGQQVVLALWALGVLAFAGSRNTNFFKNCKDNFNLFFHKHFLCRT